MGNKKFIVNTRRKYNGQFIVGDTRGFGENRGKEYFRVEYDLEGFHGIQELDEKFRYKLGVYQISVIEKSSGRTMFAYVGESSRGFAARWREHGMSIGAVNAAQRGEKQRDFTKENEADGVISKFLSPQSFHIAIAKLFAGKKGYKLRFEILAMTSIAKLGFVEAMFIDKILNQYKGTSTLVGNVRKELLLPRIKAAYNKRVPEEYEAKAPAYMVEVGLLIAVVKDIMERKKDKVSIPYSEIMKELFIRNFMFTTLGLSYSQMITVNEAGKPVVKEELKKVIINTLYAWKEYIDFTLSIETDGRSGGDTNLATSFSPSQTIYKCLEDLIIRNTVINEAEVSFKNMKFTKEKAGGGETKKARLIIDGVIYGSKGTQKTGGQTISMKILEDYANSNEYQENIIGITTEALKKAEYFKKQNKRIEAQNLNKSSIELMEEVKKLNNKDSKIDLFIGTEWNK